MSRELGWLVEDAGSGPQPRYRTIEQGMPVWTTDPNKAIRFARRSDAEMFCAEDEDAWRVTEHMWIDSTDPESHQPHCERFKAAWANLNCVPQPSAFPQDVSCTCDSTRRHRASNPTTSAPEG